MLLKVMERYFYKNKKLRRTMKKEVITFLSSVFLIPLISAQSISDIFSFIDAQTIFILVVFGVLGLLLSTILNKFPAFQGTTAGLISILLSLGATYGINKWFSLNDTLGNIGFSGDIFLYLLIAFLVLLVILLFKYRGKTLMILGILLTLIALFTDLVNDKLTTLIIGAILFLIGTIWWWKRRNRLPGNPSTPGVINGMPRLIAEAKAYRVIADKQPNPGMYRNWAHFINYLKSRGYGNNETEISQRMNVMPSNIIDATKKYIL